MENEITYNFSLENGITRGSVTDYASPEGSQLFVVDTAPGWKYSSGGNQAKWFKNNIYVK